MTASHTAKNEQGPACLWLAAPGGEISACNAAAHTLLGTTDAALVGRSCVTALAMRDHAGRALQYAMAAGTPVTLPPFVSVHGRAAELVLGGFLLPVDDQPQADYGLIVWRLLSIEDLQPLGIIEPSDTIAVLGVDRLRYDEHWREGDTAALMHRVQASLRDIVRARDSVALLRGSAIVIVLRDTDIDRAQDISRALLSHLHNVHTGKGSATAGARICIGLAHPAAGDAVLDTLLAANTALAQARSSGSGEHIRVATDDDAAFMLGHVLTEGGVFSRVARECSGQAVPDVAANSANSANSANTVEQVLPTIAPIESNIDGYVGDNMEGAVDQAIFLAKLDIPVAIIGPAGTGKMYVARIIHEESGAAADMLVPVDCREFKSRKAADARIARELARGEGKTLVFKSPHLMNHDAQLKLARQISSRTLADVSPPRYLPAMKLIGLFPDALEALVRKGQLSLPLASAFAGYPITVPPIRDRKQAVLRWAHKILGQEGLARDRSMKGFTPDAERAMLQYEWPGNISEMRRCIYDALEKTDKDWLTPVDLGLFKGIDPEGAPYLPESMAFLTSLDEAQGQQESYAASTVESLDVALGEAVHNLLEVDLIKPLGTWLEDDLVLAALDRYRNDIPQTASFLHTKPRNISRWLAKIHDREAERGGSALWQTPRRLLREWVRESAQPDESPLLLMQDKLMAHVSQQAAQLSAAKRACIMGVSTPTYLKRLKESAGN